MIHFRKYNRRFSRILKILFSVRENYYGEIVNANENYVIKSKMKDSTTKFYSYVSLYIVTKGQRLTLAVFPTKKGVPNVEYLRRFLKIIADMKVKITVLCLDRGFYSKDVFTFL